MTDNNQLSAEERELLESTLETLEAKQQKYAETPPTPGTFAAAKADRLPAAIEKTKADLGIENS